MIFFTIIGQSYVKSLTLPVYTRKKNSFFRNCMLFLESLCFLSRLQGIFSDYDMKKVAI